jgi:hypothetical protein
MPSPDETNAFSQLTAKRQSSCNRTIRRTRRRRLSTINWWQTLWCSRMLWIKHRHSMPSNLKALRSPLRHTELEVLRGLADGTQAGTGPTAAGVACVTRRVARGGCYEGETNGSLLPLIYACASSICRLFLCRENRTIIREYYSAALEPLLSAEVDYRPPLGSY